MCNFQEYRKIGGDPDYRPTAAMAVQCSAKISLKWINCHDPSSRFCVYCHQGRLITFFKGYISLTRKLLLFPFFPPPVCWLFPALGLSRWSLQVPPVPAWVLSGWFHPQTKTLHIRVDLKCDRPPWLPPVTPIGSMHIKWTNSRHLCW